MTTRARSEVLEQRTATSEVLRTIRSARCRSNVHTILDMSERCYSAGAGAAAHVTYATQKLRVRKGCVREPGEQRPDLHSHQGLASIGAGRPRSYSDKVRARNRATGSGMRAPLA